MIKAIFWDNDGVLVDTEPLYYEATREVLASAGIALSEADYKDLFLLQGRGAWHLAAARGLGPAEIERLRGLRNDRYSERLKLRSRAIAGVDAVLGLLQGRYPMGVVTSSRKDHFELIHAQTGFLKYFDFILTADDVARVKPDPELYLRAVARAGVRPDECLAIEDSERGLEAALAAGIRCAIVPTALTKGCRFTGAEHVLDEAGDLPGVLESLRVARPGRLTAVTQG